jgi:hypothetical protein
MGRSGKDPLSPGQRVNFYCPDGRGEKIVSDNSKCKFFVCLHGDKIYNSFVCGNTT